MRSRPCPGTLIGYLYADDGRVYFRTVVGTVRRELELRTLDPNDGASTIYEHSVGTEDKLYPYERQAVWKP